MKTLESRDYLETFVALKDRIKQAQYRSYSAVNSEMILAYLDIGKTLSEKTKIGWGNFCHSATFKGFASRVLWCKRIFGS